MFDDFFFLRSQVSFKRKPNVVICAGYVLSNCVGVFEVGKRSVSRSRWPLVLRRRSVAIHLLGLWFRIPPSALMFGLLWVLCGVLVEVCASGWSLVQRSSTECEWSWSPVRGSHEPESGRSAAEIKTRSVISKLRTTDFERRKFEVSRVWCSADLF